MMKTSEAINKTKNINDLIYKLREFAKKRSSISPKKSEHTNEPDIILDLMEEAAKELSYLNRGIQNCAYGGGEITWVYDLPYVCLNQGVDAILLLPEELEEILKILKTPK